MGVYNFQKRSSIIKCNENSVSKVGKLAAILARSEGLEAHAKSAEMRYKILKKLNQYKKRINLKDKRNLWSPDVCKISPYIPGEQTSNDDFIKLNTNESPLPPSPYVFEAINKAADDALRLYPDPESQELRDVIADYFSVERSNVFLGNGSDEVLAHAFNAFLKKVPNPIPRFDVQLLSCFLSIVWYFV